MYAPSISPKKISGINLVGHIGQFGSHAVTENHIAQRFKVGQFPDHAGGIGIDNGADQVVGHLVVVGQQLLGVFGQAIATVTEGGVVVVAADTGIKANPFDNLATVQTMRLGIGIQLVKIGDPHRQIGVGKQLDRSRLGTARQQYRNILLDRPFLQQVGKTLGPLAALPHHNARGMQVVITALPSRKNSGEKIRFSVPSSSRIRSVKPTGMVDLITINAPGLMAITSRITASTVLVLKLLVSGS